MSKRVVRCKTETEKKAIRGGWSDEMEITKTAYAAKHGVSLRTLNRIFEEGGGVVDPQEYQPDVVEWNYFISANDVTVLRNEDSRSISRGFPRFNSIRKELIDDPSDEELEAIFRKMSVENSIEDMSEGDIHVKDGKVYYGTFEIKNSLADHLLKMLSKRDNAKPFVRFMNKLMANPKEDIVEELFGFMKHNKMDINEEGNIIAFKGVTDHYKDQWTKTIDNNLGAKPVMPRSMVEHNPKVPCAPGLHCGSYKYALGWASREVKVEVDPRNVCSVPWDYDSQKMRTCGYEVIEILN